MPHYRPASRISWKSPWDQAMYIGVFWPGMGLRSGYRVVAGRLWEVIR